MTQPKIAKQPRQQHWRVERPQSFPMYSAVCPDCQRLIGFRSETVTERRIETMQTLGAQIFGWRAERFVPDGDRECRCGMPPLQPEAADGDSVQPESDPGD